MELIITIISIFLKLYLGKDLSIDTIVTLLEILSMICSSFSWWYVCHYRGKEINIKKDLTCKEIMILLPLLPLCKKVDM